MQLSICSLLQGGHDLSYILYLSYKINYDNHVKHSTGLGIAYAGTQRQEVLSHLLPVLADTTAPPEICALAAVACGLIAVGSCNGDVSSRTCIVYLLLSIVSGNVTKCGVDNHVSTPSAFRTRKVRGGIIIMETECLNIRLPVPTLLFRGYSVKLKKIIKPYIIFFF